MKGKYEEYESMRIDQLKQEMYKLRYELATADKRKDLKHYEKEYYTVKKILTKKLVEEKIQEMEDNPELYEDEIRRGGK